MSDQIKSNNIPTNEEIVEELTKDLESQCIDENDQDKIDPESNFCTPEDFDKSDTESESSKKLVPEDFIDEEALKENETNLTDDQKEENLKQSLVLKNKGNDEFKNSDYKESIQTYTDALRLCPIKYTSDRSILYSNRAASKVKLERKEVAIEDCTKSIELNPEFIKAYLRRAKLYEETEKFEESLEDWKKIIELNPDNNEARAAAIRLPPIISERNEKIKTEMLGKLKDLGNMILRPFGLSTDNFQLQQDPNSGGYSVNFQQAPKN